MIVPQFFPCTLGIKHFFYKLQSNSLLKTENKPLSLSIGTCAALMTFPVSEYSDLAFTTNSGNF